MKELKPHHLDEVATAIETLEIYTETPLEDITEALVGVCIDEEDEGEILRRLRPNR